MTETEAETYVIHAKTERSSVAVGTQDPAGALRRAKDMTQEGSSVSITDRGGNTYTIDEMEARVASGVYVKPASSGR